jgi:putative membrane protein
MNDIVTLFLLQGLAVVITSAIIPGLRVTSVFGPLLMVVGMAILNSYLWDRSLFEAIPNEFTYRALQLLVANGVLFWLLVKLLPGIEVDGILPAIAGPVVFTVVSLLVRQYGSQVDWLGLWERLKSFVSGLKVHFLDSTASIINLNTF